MEVRGGSSGEGIGQILTVGRTEGSGCQLVSIWAWEPQGTRSGQSSPTLLSNFQELGLYPKSSTEPSKVVT